MFYSRFSINRKSGDNAANLEIRQAQTGASERHEWFICYLSNAVSSFFPLLS